jgi:mannose-6-phosphate isomerase-like protein (cupin superfamily)
MILPVMMLLAFQAPMLENESVLVHMSVDQPHKKGPLHKHDRDRVMIYLDNGRMRIENQDGKVENQTWKAGQVAWSPAGGYHTSENIGDSVLRIIEIELKPVALSAKPYTISPIDPTKVNPEHIHPEFENSKVRVFRGDWGPHEDGKMHEHLHYSVVAYLTECELTTTTPDGKAQTTARKADSVSWNGPAKHRLTVGDKPANLVVVELKNP